MQRFCQMSPVLPTKMRRSDSLQRNDAESAAAPDLDVLA